MSDDMPLADDVLRSDDAKLARDYLLSKIDDTLCAQSNLMMRPDYANAIELLRRAIMREIPD